MDIKEAYEVLEKYYPNDVLRTMYRKKKFDGSETDSIQKLGYNAELLMEKWASATSEEERHRISAAAEVFRNHRQKAHWQR